MFNKNVVCLRDKVASFVTQGYRGSSVNHSRLYFWKGFDNARQWTTRMALSTIFSSRERQMEKPLDRWHVRFRVPSSLSSFLSIWGLWRRWKKAQTDKGLNCGVMMAWQDCRREKGNRNRSVRMTYSRVGRKHRSLLNWIYPVFRCHFSLNSFNYFEIKWRKGHGHYTRPQRLNRNFYIMTWLNSSRPLVNWIRIQLISLDTQL